MKTINRLYLVTVVYVIMSCHDVLEVTPFSQTSTENFYQNADDFETAVSAVYDVLQDGRLYGGEFEFLLEVRSDNGVFNDPASESGEPYSIDKFTVTSANSYIEDAYTALYQGVQRANAVLSRIDDVDFDQNLKNQYKGESLFLRALFYFHLVQLYGDLPLITKEIGVEEARALSRDDASEIYVQIEEDLIAASELLPDSYDASEMGRVTAMAATGILAKVYLTEKNFSQSKLELEKVIESGQFSLLSTVSEVFSTSSEYNEEILFAVRYLKGEGGEGHDLLFGYTQNPTIGDDLWDAYSSVDERLALVEYVSSTGGRMVPGKYYDVLSTSDNSGNDIPVLRYADVLLMYAEVLNELEYTGSADADAFVSLNSIRTRAGLEALTPTQLPNQITFRNAVYEERRLELALEFQRWYDLKRTDTAISTFSLQGVDVEECRLIYPIPQTEIDVYNDIVQFPQNECYN